MPFDPTKPANSTNASSAEMRAQFTALHTDIQSRALTGDLAANIAANIATTALNPTAVQTFAEQSVSFGGGEAQQLAAKLDELILALRRV